MPVVCSLAPSPSLPPAQSALAIERAKLSTRAGRNLKTPARAPPPRTRDDADALAGRGAHDRRALAQSPSTATTPQQCHSSSAQERQLRAGRQEPTQSRRRAVFSSLADGWIALRTHRACTTGISFACLPQPLAHAGQPAQLCSTPARACAVACPRRRCILLFVGPRALTAPCRQPSRSVPGPFDTRLCCAWRPHC